MKILLTGASGFLGKYFIKHISHYHNLETLGRGDDCNYKCDLPNQVPIFKNDFDMVIHAAGKVHLMHHSQEKEVDFFRVNHQGTLNLLLALENTQLASFVFISSVAVYGLQDGELINENFPLSATDPYGMSKMMAEASILEWCNKWKIKCTILRLPLVIGSNPPGNLGAIIKGIQGGYYFNIDRGKARKSMVLAHDVASFILKAAEVGGVYNLTDGYHPSFSELSFIIAKKLGKKTPRNMPYWLAKILAFGGDLIGDTAKINSYKLKKITSDLTFDDAKAQDTFGWNPTHVLDGFKILENNL